jgi:hypothetical protein
LASKKNQSEKNMRISNFSVERFKIFLNKALLLLVFNQNIESFISQRGVVVGVNPLCGTRTFLKLTSIDLLSLNKKGLSLDAVIVRDEYERILSAYNKKVQSRNDFKKDILRQLSGLRFGMSFTQYIVTLIDRKMKGYFIDKHFSPCKTHEKNNISIKDSRTVELKLSLPAGYLDALKVKASSDVVSPNLSQKLRMSNDEKQLVTLYLALYA